jgi:hypothetical protein
VVVVAAAAIRISMCKKVQERAESRAPSTTDDFHLRWTTTRIVLFHTFTFKNAHKQYVKDFFTQTNAHLIYCRHSIEHISLCALYKSTTVVDAKPT